MRISDRATIEELRAADEGDVWEYFVKPRLEATAIGRLSRRYARVNIDCLDDLLSDFWLKRPGIVATALKLTSVNDATRYLSKALHNFAGSYGDTKLDRQAHNIYRRLNKVLQLTHTFSWFGGVGRAMQFGLREWDVTPECLPPEYVTDAVRFLPVDVRLLKYASDGRESPGIGSADLIRIVRALMCGTERIMTAPQIMQIVERRWPLRVMESSLESETEPSLHRGGASTPPLPLRDFLAESLAQKIIAALSERQRAILTLLSGPQYSSLREIAKALADEGFVQTTKGTVSNELDRIELIFLALRVTSAEERLQVLSHVAELLTSPNP